VKTPRDISGKAAAKALMKAGFSHQRTTGSHFILKKDSRTVVVPLHNPIRMGTLRSLVEQAGLTMEEFVALL
jgi:predicted RNA binding protein YcfA (HicA-like mRNA interferase family)